MLDPTPIVQQAASEPHGLTIALSGLAATLAYGALTGIQAWIKSRQNGDAPPRSSQVPISDEALRSLIESKIDHRFMIQQSAIDALEKAAQDGARRADAAAAEDRRRWDDAQRIFGKLDGVIDRIEKDR